MSSGGAIIVRDERQDITTLEDLRGKRIVATQPTDLFGYQAQLERLNERGFNLHQEAAQVIYTYSPTELFDILATGKADVAFVKAGFLEIFIAFGVISPDYRSIEPITDHIVGGSKLFPYEVSTNLYSEAPILMHTSVDFNVQALVTSALLDINSTSPMATAGFYAAWRPPVNYNDVLGAMEAVGLFDRDAEVCLRASSLRDTIVCPDQFVTESDKNLAASCSRAGLSCPPMSDAKATCVCSACVPACGENQ